MKEHQGNAAGRTPVPISISPVTAPDPSPAPTSNANIQKGPLVPTRGGVGVAFPSSSQAPATTAATAVPAQRPLSSAGVQPAPSGKGPRGDSLAFEGDPYFRPVTAPPPLATSSERETDRTKSSRVSEMPRNNQGTGRAGGSHTRSQSLIPAHHAAVLQTQQVQEKPSPSRPVSMKAPSTSSIEGSAWDRHEKETQQRPPLSDQVASSSHNLMLLY